MINIVVDLQNQMYRACNRLARPYLVAIIIFSSTALCQAQGGGTFNFVYELDYRYDKTVDDTSKDYFNLIGNVQNTFFENQTNFRVDSLVTDHPKPDMGVRATLPRPNFKFYVKNTPEGITYMELFEISRHYYTEPRLMDWQLVLGKEKQIKGYHCNKATISYGGRDWVAWYTMEIPIPSGPYKFSGLPGMILQVYDTQGDFTFTYHSHTLNSTKDLDYRMNLFQGVKMERDAFLATRLRINASVQNANAFSGVEVQGVSTPRLREINKQMNRKVFIELE